MEDAGHGVDPVRFTAATKQTLIENLITDLESGRITIPASANTLLNELEVSASASPARRTIQSTW